LVLFLGAGFFAVSLAGNVRAQEYTVKDLNEQLVMATLWIQRSAEFRALSYQAYNVARMMFDVDLQKGATGKKRAVIVDIDDTVSDNTPYEAGIVDNDFGYPTGWGGMVQCRYSKSPSRCSRFSEVCG